VAIFPGAFETFCFAAYEASLAGALVVLNTTNIGFGDGTPWIDGVNCLKFDGSIGGLRDLLSQIFTSDSFSRRIGQLRPIDYKHANAPYWMKGQEPKYAPRSKPDKSSVPVSILIPNRGGAAELLAQVQDLVDDDYGECEIIIIDRGSDDPASCHALELLDESVASRGSAIKVIRCTEASNYAALVNEGIAKASHDIVAVLPNRQRDTCAFIPSAAAALGTAIATSCFRDLESLRSTTTSTSKDSGFRLGQHFGPTFS
jgi:hypothetical protein